MADSVVEGNGMGNLLMVSMRLVCEKRDRDMDRGWGSM